MSIPSFDPETGNLPPGIHEATWSEFVQIFGFSPRRQELLQGLRRALDAFGQAGCRGVYVDGSFVTSKQDPNDYDACWDPVGVDVERLLELEPLFLDEHDLRTGRTKQKAAYGGEFFVSDWAADPEGTAFLEFFQRDRDDAPKGIVLLNPLA